MLFVQNKDYHFNIRIGKTSLNSKRLTGWRPWTARP